MPNGRAPPLAGCPPVAPVEESSSPRTAGSRACRDTGEAGLELRNRPSVYASRPCLAFTPGRLPRPPASGCRNGFAVVMRLLPSPVGRLLQQDRRSPFGPVPLQDLQPYYRLPRPCAPHRTLALAGTSRLSFSLKSGPIGSRVPQQSLIRVRPPPSRASAASGSAQTHPEATTSPGSRTPSC